MGEQLVQDIGLRPMRVGGGDQVGLVDDRSHNMTFKLLSC